MIIAVGTDIIRIERVLASLERQGDRFLKRILTPEEREQLGNRVNIAPFVAKRFAAKEAVAKALGTGIGQGVSWQDITVSNDEHGAPFVRLSGAAELRSQRLGASACHISLSDEKEFALAFAVLEGTGSEATAQSEVDRKQRNE